MGYKIIHKMPINGNTLITVEGDIKPIKIGTRINNGESILLSVAMGDNKADKSAKTSLLVSGNFIENELVY